MKAYQFDTEHGKTITPDVFAIFELALTFSNDKDVARSFRIKAEKLNIGDVFYIGSREVKCVNAKAVRRIRIKDRMRNTCIGYVKSVRMQKGQIDLVSDKTKAKQYATASSSLKERQKINTIIQYMNKTSYSNWEVFEVFDYEEV